MRALRWLEVGRAGRNSNSSSTISKRFFGRKSGSGRQREHEPIQGLADQQATASFDILKHGDFSTVQRLPVLAFSSKPMFPGFYQVLQTTDRPVREALQELHKNGQNHVAGFLLKSQSSTTKGAASSSSSPPQAPHVSGALSHPVSFVENLDDLEEVGTLMQIHRIQNNWVALPQWRIKRSGQQLDPIQPFNEEELVSQHVLPTQEAMVSEHVLPVNETESVEDITEKISSHASSSNQLPEEVILESNIPPPPPEDPLTKNILEEGSSSDAQPEVEGSDWREKVVWTPFPPPPPADEFSTKLSEVNVEYYEDIAEKGSRDERLKALHHEVIASMKELLTAPFSHRTQLDQILRFYNLDNPSKLVDLVANLCTATPKELQELLKMTDVQERLET
eukprot:gene160-181_t